MKAKGKRIVIGMGAVAVVVLAVAVFVGWPHLRFWYLFEPLCPNAQGYPEYRHRQTGIIFVRLPGGTFWMGAQKTDPNGQNYDPKAKKDEAPVHQVILSQFLISKNEVTQAQWKKVMGSSPSNVTRDEDCPVEQVSWEDIQKFEARTGLTLPTEAQWEYACRAGTATPFAGKIEDIAWFRDNSGDETHPVETKAPNGFGLHDLHGNVRELVEDVYDKDFYGKPGPDPVSTTGSWSRICRVFRGGSWGDVAGDCRSSVRSWALPESQDFRLGFRPAWYWPSP